MTGTSKEILKPVTLQAAFEATLARGVVRRDINGSLARGELSRCIRNLVDAIHEDLFDPLLSVQGLKTRCGIQDNNVSSRFRHEVGLSIKEYIDALRLETARRLLLDTNSSVFDVCQTVGYYHPQTFYRAFYRSFKCTPGYLREQHA